MLFRGLSQAHRPEFRVIGGSGLMQGLGYFGEGLRSRVFRQGAAHGIPLQNTVLPPLLVFASRVSVLRA